MARQLLVHIKRKKVYAEGEFEQAQSQHRDAVQVRRA